MTERTPQNGDASDPKQAGPAGAAEVVVARIGQARATAILRTARAEIIAPAMEAAIRGGFRVVEFTLTTPGALDQIRCFSRREGLLVGAGTVLGVDQVGAAVDAGARFLVSPVVDRDVIAEACRREVVMIPGTHTPTEMLAAYEAGAPLQKLFPAPVNGPAYVRAVLGPLPFLRIVPTSGVDATNAAAFLAAGAFAVGFVNPLFDPADLEQRRFDSIEARARQLLAAVG
ncbi:MAG: bifunctional 4-hydroxy-2-oxoglutarate aldolase/2-dehydro-3-deoxy-phosphogluconate aldolase [Acidobacteriota bacterium]|nr:MAG: bifunctional 4-hydroxy-2-oxoglutarate aldolase/2-dehydro-3-deoxy-phosphogluconate aldolase [Acidobacteriota bacterium]